MKPTTPERVAIEFIKKNYGVNVKHNGYAPLDFNLGKQFFEAKSVGKKDGKIQDKVGFKVNQLKAMQEKGEVIIVVTERGRKTVLLTFKISEVKIYDNGGVGVERE